MDSIGVEIMQTLDLIPHMHVTRTDIFVKVVSDQQVVRI